jgi:hypothetical protein
MSASRLPAMTDHRRRRLLIVSRDLALLRGHYEDVIASLYERGVDVHVRYLHDKGLSVDSYREALAGRDCTVDVAPLPLIQRDDSELFALRLRQLANLLRFSHRDYQGRDWLRETKFDRAAPGPRRWARRLGRLGMRVPLFVVRLVAAADRVLPPPTAARAVIQHERPDAVVAVPVIRSPGFVDLLKAAARDGIPTACWIQSWDNLSSKGLLHFVPDRVFVWNRVQQEELGRYHGIPARNVCVTGAQTFDHWFADEKPSDRAAFCESVGLDPSRPIILYLVSSRQIEPSPAEFFERWLAAVRSSHDVDLAGASVLVRPHPTDVCPWLDLDAPQGVAVSPSTSEAPINSAPFRRRFRDELYHASVAVALNTSGLIDAAIFGKPICTVELPELAFGQRGTVHFEYLKSIGGGVLRTSASLAEHVEMLAAFVRRDPYERDERSERFVEEFIRPAGTELAPAAVFAAEMLRLVGSRSEVRPPGLLGRVVGRALSRVAPLLGVPFESNPVLRRRRKIVKRMRRQRRVVRKRLARYGARARRRLRRLRRLVRPQLRRRVLR